MYSWVGLVLFALTIAAAVVIGRYILWQKLSLQIGSYTALALLLPLTAYAHYSGLSDTQNYTSSPLVMAEFMLLFFNLTLSLQAGAVAIKAVRARACKRAGAYPFIFVGFMGMVLFFAITEFGPAAALVLIPPLCLYGIGLRRSKPARVAGYLGLMAASGILLSGIISV